MDRGLGRRGLRLQCSAKDMARLMGRPEIIVTACCQNWPALVPLLCSIIAWEQFMGSIASGQMQW